MKGKTETEHPEWLDQCCYEDRVVVLLDVLGFSQLVHDTKMNVVFAGLFTTINGLGTLYDQNDVEITGLKSTVLSDSIVLSFLKDERYVMEMLTRTMHSVLSTFAEENIFLRGAITSGQLWHHEGIVFGPALVRAHQLEQKIAIYPRCIVDPKERDQLFLGAERDQVKKSFTMDDDGLVYYDHYLNVLYDASGNGYQSDKLTRIREAIIDQLQGQKDEHVRQKYAWCANHFNRAIVFLKELGIKPPLHLRISDEIIDRTG